MKDEQKTRLSYRDAGVDIDAGNRLVDMIKPAVSATHRPEVMKGLGGFGGLFDLGAGRYNNPVLVSGTDGVGTKLKLAGQMQRHDSIGIDLVAMCVNDILTCGAEPLFFLDYFACGKLDTDVAALVVKGIADGCQQAGCALIGGETAEMPDMYPPGEYDLAGFTVGAVEKSRMIDGSQIKNGDLLIGIDSSGPHSNGYSLIRRILEVSGESLDTPMGERTLGDALLAPTRIYVKETLSLLEEMTPAGLSHITGGGLSENITRILPEGLGLEIELQSWSMPEVFNWLQAAGNVEQAEMLRTFNCGIGLVIVCDAGDKEGIITHYQNQGLGARVIGQVLTGPAEVRYL